MIPSNRLVTVSLDSEQASFTFECHYLTLRHQEGRRKGKKRKEKFADRERRY